jgi:cell wall-associated NlpC family hydrolase
MKTIAKVLLPLLMVGLTGCDSQTTSEAKQVINVQPAKVQDKVLSLVENYKRQEVKRIALSGLGVPYVFSGASKHGWDCSGFTAYVFDLLGIELEHSATKQAFQGKRVAKPGIGDLVLFSYGSSKYFYHASIYVGNNKVINANAYYGKTVIEPLSNYKYSTKRFVQVIK